MSAKLPANRCRSGELRPESRTEPAHLCLCRLRKQTPFAGTREAKAPFRRPRLNQGCTSRSGFFAFAGIFPHFQGRADPQKAILRPAKHRVTQRAPESLPKCRLAAIDRYCMDEPDCRYRFAAELHYDLQIGITGIRVEWNLCCGHLSLISTRDSKQLAGKGNFFLRKAVIAGQNKVASARCSLYDR